MQSVTPGSVAHPNFDAAYFRETRPGWAGVDDEACLEAWINDPAVAGPGCGRDHMMSLQLDVADYPTAFPWAFYVRLQPAAGANRWAALDHFCRQGFKSGVRLPFESDARGFLVSLARSYANRDDFVAIEAFELASVLAPLSPDEQQHLGDSYLRLRLFRRAHDVYRAVLRGGGGSDWTLRNCVKSSLLLFDWGAAEAVLFETKSAWEHTGAWALSAFDLIDSRLAAELRRARSKYAAGKMEGGDDDVAAAVGACADLLERFGLVPKVTRGGGPVVVVANCDDAVSYSQRAEAKSALFAQLSMPWRLIPMTDIETVFDALSGASALIFFNAPATLFTIRALQAARAAGIPVIYEADSAIFDPTCYPPPLASFDGFVMPEMHDDMRVSSGLCRGLARHCEFGLAVTGLNAAKLEGLVSAGKANLLSKVCNPDPFIFPHSVQLPGRFLFLRSPRFLALVDQPGALGAALLNVMNTHPDLGLVTSGYVHLGEGFNAYDSRLVELGPSAEPSSYRSVIAASTLTIAPKCMEGDDGMSELIWLEAAELGAPTLLDGPIAEALGLKAGETCLAVGEGGWAPALEQALSNPSRLEQIGARARDHARASRSLETVTAQLMSALRGAVKDEVVL